MFVVALSFVLLQWLPVYFENLPNMGLIDSDIGTCRARDFWLSPIDMELWIELLFVSVDSLVLQFCGFSGVSLRAFEQVQSSITA